MGSKAGKKAAQKIQIIKWHLWVLLKSLTGSAEKRDMKTVVEKMELTSVSAAQADWQFNGIIALNP